MEPHSRALTQTPAERLDGIHVVREDDFIAVLADKPDRAETALKRIRSQYDLPDNNLDDETIFDHLLKNASQGNPSAQGGDIEEGKKDSGETIQETYLNSYVGACADRTTRNDNQNRKRSSDSLARHSESVPFAGRRCGRNEYSR